MFYSNVIGYPPPPCVQNEAVEFPILDYEHMLLMEARGWEFHYEHNEHNDTLVFQHLIKALESDISTDIAQVCDALVEGKQS